jgi:copper homeostasis protein
MIRPRIGDFYYTRHEMQTIFLDIQEFKTLGIQGFVLGMYIEAMICC